MDLKITQARISGQPGLWQIGIEASRITAVASSILTSAAITINAAERLVLPGFVNAHLHLDKALILERYPAVEAQGKAGAPTGDRVWHNCHAKSC